MLPGLDSGMLQADLVSGFSVTSSPAPVSKTFSSTDGANHSGTTPTTTAVGAGGSGSYTYAWARISGDSSITATSAATAATAFTATLAPDVIARAVFRVTATDTGTGATTTFDVNVTIHHVDLR